jgi:hypothetical protein
MAKMERWIVASKMVEVLDHDTLKEIVDLGATLGGGWSEVHQHIHVTPDNKEKIEAILLKRGYSLHTATDKTVRHPDAERPGE